MLLAGSERGKSAKRGLSPFYRESPELPQNTKNKPIKAGPGTLASNSEFFSHNPFYRSFLAFKTRYKNLDFNRSFLGILGDNPRKTANISRLEAMTAIPNATLSYVPFWLKSPELRGSTIGEGI